MVVTKKLAISDTFSENCLKISAVFVCSVMLFIADCTQRWPKHL